MCGTEPVLCECVGVSVTIPLCFPTLRSFMHCSAHAVYYTTNRCNEDLQQMNDNDWSKMIFLLAIFFFIQHMHTMLMFVLPALLRWDIEYIKLGKTKKENRGKKGREGNRAWFYLMWDHSSSIDHFPWLSLHSHIFLKRICMQVRTDAHFPNRHSIKHEPFPW